MLELILSISILPIFLAYSMDEALDAIEDAAMQILEDIVKIALDAIFQTFQSFVVGVGDMFTTNDVPWMITLIICLSAARALGVVWGNK